MGNHCDMTKETRSGCTLRQPDFPHSKQTSPQSMSAECRLMGLCFVCHAVFPLSLVLRAQKFPRHFSATDADNVARKSQPTSTAGIAIWIGSGILAIMSSTQSAKTLCISEWQFLRWNRLQTCCACLAAKQTGVIAGADIAKFWSNRVDMVHKKCACVKDDDVVECVHQNYCGRGTCLQDGSKVFHCSVV